MVISFVDMVKEGAHHQALEKHINCIDQVVSRMVNPQINSSGFCNAREE